MRKRRTSGGVTLNAIAGTHVVTLGLDLSEARRAGCLGFAILREDHTEGERVWLRGLKTFKATDPELGPGQSVSTRFHPVQAFQWADYTAKPEHDYSYAAYPVGGAPGAPVLEDGVSVRVRTESELGAIHSVFFNRGALASQEYARRFMNLAPDQLTDPRERAAAYKWLSRGLLEALLAFIARATGPEFALRGAIYEFRRAEVLLALKAAAERGVDTQIVYDGIDDAQAPNEQAIAANGIAALCSPRTRGSIMHNKFLVLLRDGEPEAVWTGSTNISENGLYGQLNAGHQVDDATVARAYRDYWDQLRANPAPKDLKAWVAANSPPPAVPAPAGTTTIMSPRRGLGAARRLRDRRRQRAARAVHDLRLRHEPALPRRLPARGRRAARRADGEGGQRRPAGRGPDLHRQAAPAAQRPGRGRPEQERHRARQLEARAHGRDRHQRRLGAHEVHARRPARRRTPRS